MEEWRSVSVLYELMCERLTERQQQVGMLMMEGMSRPAIAHRLGIGWQTVDKHICHIYDRVMREWIMEVIQHGK